MDECGRMKSPAKNLINMSGLRFGRLAVVEYEGKEKWKCVCDCGSERVVHGGNLRRGITKSCGCLVVERSREMMRVIGSKIGADRSGWKGGRRIDKNGYVNVIHRESPESAGGRYNLEHRVVMSGHLGRPLLNSEHVHHKNGVRDDNRIENLELKVAPHGPKISVDDAIAWAKDILVRYDATDYYAEEELCL